MQHELVSGCSKYIMTASNINIAHKNMKYYSSLYSLEREYLLSAKWSLHTYMTCSSQCFLFCQGFDFCQEKGLDLSFL